VENFHNGQGIYAENMPFSFDLHNNISIFLHRRAHFAPNMTNESHSKQKGNHRQKAGRVAG